jgi:hypothetical protein
MDLSQIVIGEQEMNLVGEIAFEFGGATQRQPASFSTGGIEMIAVNQFVQNKMSLGIIAQIGKSKKFVEIVAMVVDVAGHPDLTFGG